jgi:alpha-1,2-mannosyltransferase
MGGVLVSIGVLMLLMRVQNAQVVSSDFTQDYVAAQALRAGRSIYVELTAADLSAAALGTRQALIAPYPIVNFHPPFDVLLFAPLTLLPYDQAVLVWSILSSLLFLGIGALVLRELRIGLAPHWCVLLLGLGLCWYPFQAHIALGQLSLLVVACVIGCWALLRQGHERLAGLLLGLACLIKLFPGLIILYLLMRRRWRAGSVALGTVAAGGLLTLALVGSGDVIYYFMRMAPEDSAVHGLSPINVALAGVIRRLLTDGPWVNPLVDAPLLATGLVGMIGLSVLIVLLRHIRNMPPTAWNEDRAFALVCVAMLLISPITWWHVFPLMLLPFGLLLQDLHTRPDRRKLGLSLLALALVSLPDLEIARTLMGMYAPYRVPWFVGLLLALPTIGLMLIWWAVTYRSQAGDHGSQGSA